MIMKIARLYKAQTLVTYNDILAYVISNNYDVNINADRDNLAVTLEFGETDSVTFHKIEEKIKKMEVIVEDTFTVKIPTDDNNIINEIANYKEQCETLRKEFGTIKKEHDEVKASKDYYVRKCNRVKEQIKAIGVMIEAIAY